MLIDSAFWRDLEAQFRALLKTPGAVRMTAGYWGGQWTLTDGPRDTKARERLHEMYRSLAEKAGKAAGAPAGKDAFTYTACRKFENAISFPETHKLWIDTNDLPDIPNGDDATFARIFPIHFPVIFANDKKLPEALRAEAEGILLDLVWHACQWFYKGLGAPAEIKQSRQEWHDESDQIQRFFHDKCVIDKNDKDLTAESTPLYDAYKE
jgi:phage/plasmid-associated DNA primase